MNHILKIFPLHIREELKKVFEKLEGREELEEIRIRVSR